LIGEASSINEVLHIIHSSITNDNNLYQSLPKVGTKTNNEGYPVTLYGYKTDLSEKVLENFPKEMSCGTTDILSIGDKILMMVRDRGHALSIEASIEGDNVIVKYFIPKICNVDMVNNLKGVYKINNQSTTATGLFVTTTGDFVGDIIDFISGVPMDTDMPIWY
jgi:hypothetical protein